MSYDEARVRWNPLWVFLWVCNVVALAVLAPVVPLRTWASLFAGLFLVPEMIGLVRHQDSLPPLTYVVRRYLPRWLPDLLTFAAGAWLAWLWRADVPAPQIAVAGMVGWLTNHWDVTYDV